MTRTMFTAGALALAAAFCLPTAAVADDDTAVANPNSSAHGATHAEWMEAYLRWNLTGEVDEDVAKNNVEMLAMPASAYIETLDDGTVVLGGHLDVTLDEGDAFVLPVVSRTGERYTDGSEDSEMPDFIFTDVITAEVLLDGDLLLEDPADYYTGAVEFDPEIEYDEPGSSGDEAAIFFQCIGFLAHPLSAGEHSLSNYVEIPVAGVAFSNTWTITVGE